MFSQSFKHSCIRGYRLMHNRVSLNDVIFREATPGDKHDVLSLRHNVYRGLDYLPDYYNAYMKDVNRTCIVGKLDGNMVAFGAMLVLDDGQSVLGQAGRVHEQYEGRGIFSAMNAYINKKAQNIGCKRRVALVETSLNKYARSEKFKQIHREITTKLHYAGVVTEEVRNRLKQCPEDSDRFTKIKKYPAEDIKCLIKSGDDCRYLFPHNRILLDYVPYRSIEENLSLLQGRNTRFYSSLETTFNGDDGLLTAGCYYRCARPPASYTIDVFGTNHSDLEDHVLFHILQAMKTISGQFCLQIFVEKGFIAQELCKTLLKLDVPKCDWYVEGGVTTKTIVEEKF